MKFNETFLPENWKLVDLPDVVFFQEGPGVRKHQFTENGVKLLNVRNIVDNKLVLENTETYISDEEANGRYSHFLVDEGDLIIASSGIKVDYFHKKIAFVERKHLPLCMNTSTIRFKSLNPDVLDINYFKHFMKTPFFAKQVQFHITGSAQLNFGPSHLKKMKIVLPPLQTQKKIVEILEKAEKLKIWRAEADGLTEDYLNSLFFVMFDNPVKNPKNWEKQKIKSFVINVSAGWSAKGEDRTKNDDELGVLKISAVTWGEFQPNEHKAVKKSNITKSLIRPMKGDILFSRANTRELVAAVCMVNEDREDLFLPDKLWKIEINNEIVNPYYFLFVLRNESFRNELRKKSTGTSGSMLNISKKKLIETDFPIPPIELQNQFAHIVKQVIILKTHQKQSKKQIDNLFNTLMQKAFKGELTC